VRRIGYFIHRTPSGRLIGKSLISRPPRIGIKIYNSKGKLVGKIVDIIGPINSPYIVIKPLNEPDVKPYEELFIR